MGLGQTNLPGQTRMMDTGSGAGAGTAVITADENDIGSALGHTCGNGAHTGFRNQLDVDPCVGIGVLKVEDKLGQVLNGVNIMVRGRGDKTHTGG